MDIHNKCPNTHPIIARLKYQIDECSIQLKQINKYKNTKTVEFQDQILVQNSNHAKSGHLLPKNNLSHLFCVNQEMRAITAVENYEQSINDTSKRNKEKKSKN